MSSERKNIQSRVTGGVILILIGFAFLVSRLDIIQIDNWWAFFILIPAISSFGNIFEEIASGRGRHAAITSGIVGILFPVAIACMFLFELSWIRFWPVFVILAGFSMFLTAFIESSEPLGNFVVQFRPWLMSWGLGVILFGSYMLLSNVELLPAEYDSLRWLGIPIIVAASGGIFSALRSPKGQPGWAKGLHLMTAVVFAIPGVFALMGIQAGIVLPVLIIAFGIVIIFSFVAKTSD